MQAPKKRNIGEVIFIILASICGAVALLAFVMACFFTVAEIAAKGKPEALWLCRINEELNDSLNAAHEISWSELANAWTGASAAFLAGGTIFLLILQLKIARDDAEWNLRSARLQACIVRVDAARARVETLWKGSELAFDKQHFDGEDFSHITDQLIAGSTDATKRRIMSAAVDEWEISTERLAEATHAFDEFERRYRRRA